MSPMYGLPIRHPSGYEMKNYREQLNCFQQRYSRYLKPNPFPSWLPMVLPKGPTGGESESHAAHLIMSWR